MVGWLTRTAPSPGPVRTEVSAAPSRIRNRSGKRSSQPRLAAGTYWRAFASTATTPGTRAASPSDCT